jgi:hypothetical protein
MIGRRFGLPELFDSFVETFAGDFVVSILWCVVSGVARVVIHGLSTLLQSSFPDQQNVYGMFGL